MALLTSREKEIMRILSDDSTQSASQLSARLGVSAVTIRTDLNNLASKGYMVLRRGAAFPAFHQSILDRQETGMEEKNRIAKAAAELIHDGDRIMLVAGTTPALVAKYLFGKRDVHIVTNSTLLLPYVRINPSVHVTLVGGEFRPWTEGVVGPIALAELKRFHVQMAFIGCDGLTPDKGATAHHVEDAEVVRTMAEQSEKLVLVTDSTKYGKTGFAHMLPLAKIDMLITDDKLDAAAKAQLTELGVEFKVV
ncbi:MAG TPA: DeoR/GlpR family DNA-binding transcription regulator [Planctomycetota bacterium]|jgi:DeoR family galactitol utilization operon repressor